MHPLDYFKYKKVYRTIKKSGLFDYKYYLFTYPDVRKSDIDAIKHYILYGVTEGRNPNASFDTKTYLNLNQDIKKSNLNPLFHYIVYGKKEGRQTKYTIRKPIKEVKKSPPIQEKEPNLLRFGCVEYGPINKTFRYDTIEKIEIKDTTKVCLHLHLYYVDQLSEFIEYFNNITFSYDLLVSLNTEEDKDIYKDKLQHNLKKCEKIFIKNIPINRGRDVSSWLVLWAKEIAKYELFYHAHTKKSSYSSKYKNWRRFLLHNTLGSSNITSSIYKEFTNPNLTLLYPAYFCEIKNQPQYGGNKAIMQKILSQIDAQQTLPQECMDYPAGSFFWCRTSLLKPLFDLNLKYEDFDEEDGSLDGTLAHAIERLIGYLPVLENKATICSRVDVAFDLINYYSDKRELPIKQQNTQEYETEYKTPDKVLKGKKVAIYTAITGEFENFIKPTVIDAGFDYYCISDNQISLPKEYKLIKTKYIDSNPRKTARFAKLHPHFYFREYDYVIWVDANILALNGFSEYLKKHIENGTTLSLIKHPNRESYIQEAKECIRIKADNAEIIEEQLSTYEAEDIDANNLIETNVIISSLKDKKSKTFYATWWSQIEKYSIRDQLSVNYALQKSKASYTLLLEDGKSVRDDKNFMLFAHNFTARDAVIRLKLEEKKEWI